MSSAHNKSITTVAEWRATFLPNGVTQKASSDVPNLMLLAHAAARRAVDEVRGKAQTKRRSPANKG